MKNQVNDSKQSLSFNNQLALFEQYRFGAMAAMITFQSLLGSIAAMYSLNPQNLILLSICCVLTMGSNSAFIAQSPAKWCLVIFYASIIANTLIIIGVNITV
jgi:hypothetical protein